MCKLIIYSSVKLLKEYKIISYSPNMVRVHESVTYKQRGATLQCVQERDRSQGAVDILGQDTLG